MIARELRIYQAPEIPDVIAWNYRADCTVIECKCNRKDFTHDISKPIRIAPDALGRYRYYMAPPLMISPSELPTGWGLLEVTQSTIRKIVPAPDHGNTNAKRLNIEAQYLYQLAKKGQNRDKLAVRRRQERQAPVNPLAAMCQEYASVGI